MIIGGILIAIALTTYYLYYPKLPPKGSVAYYKYRWRQITN
jgi:hypothetical protein